MAFSACGGTWRDTQISHPTTNWHLAVSQSKSNCSNALSTYGICCSPFCIAILYQHKPDPSLPPQYPPEAARPT